MNIPEFSCLGEMHANMSDGVNCHSRFGTKQHENHKNHLSRDVVLGADLWTDGLICAFEFVRGRRKMVQPKNESSQSSGLTNSSSPKVAHHLSKSSPVLQSGVTVKEKLDEHNHNEDLHSENLSGREENLPRSYWIPIGWARISQLVQTVQVDSGWASQPIDFTDEEEDGTFTDVATPYWERKVGPTWWCHVDADHPHINEWLSNAQWLHPAICTALRDENKLKSERMKHLLYESVVDDQGILFHEFEGSVEENGSCKSFRTIIELLGQSVGDSSMDKDDIPIVLRSWQAQIFLLTALHIKGHASNLNVLGIAEVQELLAAGCINVPRTIYEVIAQLVNRLARWDDRLFRRSIFGAADEVELKFMNRRTQEDMHLFSITLNQEIRRLSTQVIRVKWSLHAREEIVFELLQHVRENLPRALLEGSTVRAWLQDRSLTVTHNLGVFGGCGLVLSIITGLFGINLDGIPGAEGSPYAFALFSGILFLLGAALIAIGLLYLGLKSPITDEHVEVRKLELQELVRIFQQEAESHAQVRKTVPRATLPPAAAGVLSDGASYVLLVTISF
ncbi:hypothetical protein Patl1_01452 [Pistacia atlantica]|uniref:Uncharacterized protein n=1 Tax=Pistacia atlantica TaxID=434234 RepID=A0ACC1C700_9ROSI|nr:hypothetical protein Patl1_01452 [Pistacia atlantica]